MLFLAGLLAVSTVLIATYPGVTPKIVADFLTGPCLLVPLLSALFGGLLRGAAFHPATNDRYARWLAATPWQPGTPLPFGGVYPNWRDALFVFVMTLLSLPSAWLLQQSPYSWLIPCGPTLIYLVGLTIAWTGLNFGLGEEWCVLGVFAVTPVLSLPLMPVETTLLTPFFTAVIASYGIKRGLDRFPWEDLNEKISPLDPASPKQRKRRSTTPVGWPHEQLLGETNPFRRTWPVALMHAWIVGGWLLVIASLAYEVGEDPGVAIAFAVLVAPIFALWRLVAYWRVSCAQFCWGFRRATGRWIIPEHDVIYLPPLLILFVGLPWAMLFPVLYPMLQTGWGALFGMLSAAACVLIARRMGPDLETLWLTGVQQMKGSLPSGGGKNKQQFAKLSGENG